MSPLIQLKKPIAICLVALLLTSFGVPLAQAVTPPPDGGYPGGNTAEGQDALLNLSTGGFNTAVGVISLKSNMTGAFNTAIGAGTLLANDGDQNTATGAAALLNNTTGQFNTAVGAVALFQNTSGPNNTATGQAALFNNTTGSFNTATGSGALAGNTTGDHNTAIGVTALRNNATGNGNTILGADAGGNVMTANNVICIGANVGGADISDTCFIGSIFGVTSSGGTAVFINSSGQLGTMTSSARFKDNIKPMDQASEALFSLKPVSFRYKKEVDPAGTSQLGLVAEDVEKVSADLVVHSKDGKPYSVRYDQVNAMLLNEFLKEHQKVQQLEANGTRQQKQIEALTAGLQKVSAELEASRAAPQTAANNQ